VDYDLALLKLASKPSHLDGLQLLFDAKFNDNFITVGFGMKGERDGCFMSRDGFKRATQIPYLYRSPGKYCHVNGYNFIKLDEKVLLEKMKDEFVGSGVSLGMSGGALINEDNQLLGITSHSFTPSDEYFSESNPLETEQFKQSTWLRNKFSTISAVLSYISSLPVPGLNPITAQGTYWIDINCDLHRNWLLETMELNSNPEEFAEIRQFHDGTIFQGNACKMM
jgi:hypothetical protein